MHYYVEKDKDQILFMGSSNCRVEWDPLIDHIYGLAIHFVGILAFG